MAHLDNYLRDLGIAVSTGPVVDFRATAYLRTAPERDTVPLLYPAHLVDGAVSWPRLGRAKWNAFVVTDASRHLTLPAADYVLVKRFTAKEERRRIVAAVHDGASASTDRVAFENHLNYFHEDGGGLPVT